MSTLTRPRLHARGDDPGKRLDADFGLGRESLVVNETHEAARAVAALLDLAAVGVPDTVAEIRIDSRRFLDQKDLVAADAEVAVRDLSGALRGHLDRATHAVQDDEVVAGSLHLGEFQLQYHFASPGGRVLSVCASRILLGHFAHSAPR